MVGWPFWPHMGMTCSRTIWWVGFMAHMFMHLEVSYLSFDEILTSCSVYTSHVLIYLSRSISTWHTWELLVVQLLLWAHISWHGYNMVVLAHSSMVEEGHTLILYWLFHGLFYAHLSTHGSLSWSTSWLRIIFFLDSGLHMDLVHGFDNYTWYWCWCLGSIEQTFSLTCHVLTGKLIDSLKGVCGEWPGRNLT